MGDTVKYEVSDAVAVISMNRPDSLNGFTTGLCTELLAAFENAHRDDAVRAVVFTGEGRAFSAGGMEASRPITRTVTVTIKKSIPRMLMG